MNAAQRFLAAPARGIQIAIWALLVATVGTALPAVLSSASPAVTHAQSATLAVDDLVLAADDGVGAAPWDNASDAELDNPTELLPAWRWHSVMDVPEDLGQFDIPQKATGSIADMQFSLAGWIWGLLLALMNWALTTDVVSTFSGTINGFFATTYLNLKAAGIPLIIGAAVALLALVRALRGKLNESVRMGVSALVVLGLLQSLGGAAVAAQNPGQYLTPGTPVSSTEAPRGTPAWLAMIGNDYVNEIAMKTSTVFGATQGITGEVSSGTAWAADAGAGGATCAAYNQRLYATYHSVMAERGGAEASAAAAMEMVSFMWQRSMYDAYVTAGWAVPQDGALVACHYLEGRKGISPERQLTIATGLPGYEGIGIGPFVPGEHKKDNQAVVMGWAVCENGTAGRPGWDKLPHFNDTSAADACRERWEDETGAGLTDAATEALGWQSLDALRNDTVGGNNNDNPRGAEIQSIMLAYYGHNQGQRLMAGTTALATAGLYAYAFGAPAVGAMLTQFVLLFMLVLLPWTLVMLAMPDKQGHRNAMGKRLLRLTMMAFGGKIVFLLVLGVTITVLSALFSLVEGPTVSYAPGASAADASSVAGFGDQIWTLLIPVIAIVVMRMLMKGAGLGNLMGLGGALGFATAAIKQGKDGAWASSKLGGAGQSLKGTLAQGRKNLSEGRKIWSKAAQSPAGNAMGARALLAKTGRDGKPWLERDLADKVAQGKISAWQARREQKFRHAGYGEDLAEKLATRKIGRVQALGLAGGRSAYAEATAAAAIEARRNNGTSPLGALAGGPVDADGADAANPFIKGVIGSAGFATSAELSEARAVRNHIAAAKAGSVGPEQWASIQTEMTGAGLEELTRIMRHDGSAGELTPAQQAKALEVARAQVHPAMAGDVVLGISGLPALVRPHTAENGSLSVPPEALTDPELAVAYLRNPLSRIDPALTAQGTNESLDAYHVRMHATLVETGLIDTGTGRVPDFALEAGIDTRKDGWQEKALAAIRDAHEMNNDTFFSSLRTVDADGLARINNATRVILDTTTEYRSDVTGGQWENIAASANVVTRKVDDLTGSIDKVMGTIAVSVPDPTTHPRNTATLLQYVERDSAQLLEEALAERIKAQRLDHELKGWSPESVQEEFERDLGRAQQVVDDYQREMAKLISKVKGAGALSNQNELAELAKAAQTAVSSAANLMASAKDSAAQVVGQAQYTRNLALMNSGGPAGPPPTRPSM